MDIVSRHSSRFLLRTSKLMISSSSLVFVQNIPSSWKGSKIVRMLFQPLVSLVRPFKHQSQQFLFSSLSPGTRLISSWNPTQKKQTKFHSEGIDNFQQWESLGEIYWRISIDFFDFIISFPVGSLRASNHLSILRFHDNPLCQHLGYAHSHTIDNDLASNLS